MFTFTRILGALLCLNAAGASSGFTAGFDEKTGVTGYMQLKIQPAEMFYSYSLDFTNYATTCDLSQGLSYHIHSFWTDETATSSTSCADAGGHYDPYLACGPSSQEKDGLCKSLNRTSSQGYTYACNSENYGNGKHYACEAGDLSGKFGRMMPSEQNGKIFQGQFVDPSPVLSANFGTPEGIANQWMSVVIHCPADNSRLVCAQLIRDKCLATKCF